MSRVEKWLCLAASFAGICVGFGMAAWAYTFGVPPGTLAAPLIAGVLFVVVFVVITRLPTR